ncbi:MULTISPECIES: GGDEF domain-containing protein [unclassified Bradyrhizobium]|uniref:GGDEF domain-containing protein n=1 Tax=unclassified Bradyrhizobium TaxID=2631580 RepID=UPI002916E648|nr:MULTISPECIES: GGDEF domain-containing protein [unclassified Bradyrhizobium]
MQQINDRIALLRERLINSIIPEAEFRAEIAGHLTELAKLGLQAQITIKADEAELASYRANEAVDRAVPADYRNSVSERGKSVVSIVEAWYGSGGRPEGVDQCSNELGLLTNLHWGDRDPMTLLPFFKVAGTEKRVLEYAALLTGGDKQIAIVHIDLDKFKDVNTEFGEPGGDAVLVEFGRRLRETFSDDGVVFRKGGEEFSMIMAGDPSDILLRLEKFRKRMEIEPFAVIGRANTCSIGVAIFKPSDLVGRMSRFDDLSAEAQHAERRAKAEGRNCIRLPCTAESDCLLRSGELERAAIDARLALGGGDAISTDDLADALTEILASELAEKSLVDSVHIPAGVARRFGLRFGSNDRAKRPLEAQLPLGSWAAAVARSLLRATFRLGVPLKADSSLSFHLSEPAGDATSLSVVVEESATAYRIPIANGLNLESGCQTTVSIGRPWFSSSADGIVRWDGGSAGAGNASQIPVLLLPIGDTAISLAKQERDRVADVVEIDDRPVVGGGLPDFWQSNLARVIGACLRNPNITTIIVVGNASNAAATLDKLQLDDKSWTAQAYDLQRRLSISLDKLQAFRERKIQVTRLQELTVFKLRDEIRNAIGRLVPDMRPGAAINLEAEAQYRRLPLAQPPEAGRLLVTDGLRTTTMAYAYPQAINLLRSSETPAQTEATQRRFREFSTFKLVLTNPFAEPVPDYWKSEFAILEDYFDRNFVKRTGLFGRPLLAAEPDGVSLYEKALAATVEALKENRPTRRVMLPVHSAIQFDQPLGLGAIQVMPRRREGRWNLDFQWIWRTVEALVGFPFSAYGSISWSKRFFDEVESRMQQIAPAVPLQRGELTYLALSFHMFLDAGDREIARAIVQDASH